MYATWDTKDMCEYHITLWPDNFDWLVEKVSIKEIISKYQYTNGRQYSQNKNIVEINGVNL